ncbi:tRNA lysidine(34) synthetase TilS [Novipirellula herctigrandis]
MISRRWPVSRWGNVGVVVGVSGGADSVGLLRGLCEIRSQQPAEGRRGFIVAAHLNHAIRGEESDADEAFVRDLAQSLDVPIVVERIVGSDVTDEASLRENRMAFVRTQAENVGARYVALGHTSDDNVETVLHHLFRGTGPTGLAGIAPHRSLGDDLVLVRPMLAITREQIRAGLRHKGCSWREDASNQDPRYRRNWIRHKLIPMITSKYPNAEAAISRASESQRDWLDLVDSAASEWIDIHICVDGHACEADTLRLRRDSRTDGAIVVAALQRIWGDRNWALGEMTKSHWQSIVGTIAGRSSQRYQLPGGLDVRASGDHVTITPI